MITLQEKEKTHSTFNVSQWNQTFLEVHFGHFCWSILHEIDNVKGNRCIFKLCQRLKNANNGHINLCSDSSDIVTGPERDKVENVCE